MTDVIVYCDSDYHSCTGTADKGYCAQGYIGPLCETCDNYGEMWGEQYAQTSTYANKACNFCSALGFQQ